MVGASVPPNASSASPLSTEATAHLRERLRAIHDAGKAIIHAGDLDSLFHALHAAATRLMEVDNFLLALYHPASETVEVIRQIASGTELPGGSFPLGGGLTSQVIRTGEPRLVRQLSTEVPPAQVQYASDRPGLPESSVTVPLLGARDAAPVVLGVISVQSFRPNAYDELDLLTLEVIAGQAAISVDHLRHSQRLDAQYQRRVIELEAILSSMADALLIVDADGCIVRLNRAARELLAGEQSVVLGQPLSRELWGQWPLAGRAVAEELSRIIDALRAGEHAREIDVEINPLPTADTTPRRVFSFSCARLHDENGAFAGGVVVFRDVTERREVERLKDEVLQMASHDLKTPVTVMKGQADLLLRRLSRGTLPPEDIPRALESISHQADRLTYLLDLLLDYSRIQAGRFELDRTTVDLGQLASLAAESVRTLSQRHRIVVHAPPGVVGQLDAPRLDQVLQNLLSNAIKYSPQGGDVELRVSTDGGDAVVSVTDHGMGLAPEELPRVFDRFYRTAGARGLQGTGLGLSICRAIVEAHGGRIWAESPGPGNGTTFSLTLPLHN